MSYAIGSLQRPIAITASPTLMKTPLTQQQLTSLQANINKKTGGAAASGDAGDAGDDANKPSAGLIVGGIAGIALLAWLSLR